MLRPSEIFNQFDLNQKSFLTRNDLNCSLIYVTGKKLEYVKVKKLFDENK